MRWFILAIAFLSSSATALEIRYTRENPFSGGTSTGGESLLLVGEIVSGDYPKLVRLVSSDEPRYLNSAGIVLASRGGDVQEALKIAQFVKATYRQVFVGPHFGSCVSACFLIFASAVTRLADPNLVGLHRPYLVAEQLEKLSVTEAETRHQAIQKAVRDYLSSLQIPIQLIDTMMSRASTEIYWLSRDDLGIRVGRRAPWYEQFLIGRCGLDKNRETEYFTGKSERAEDILNHLRKVENCSFMLITPEAFSFITAESKKLHLRK